MVCSIKNPCPGTKQVRVIIPASHSHIRHEYTKLVEIDACVVDIVEIFQCAGIRTTGSCCGHGDAPGSIRLEDGRELMVVFPSDAESAQEARANDALHSNL